jgi:hypothetical protein
MDGSEETGARVRQIGRDVFGFAVLRPAQVEAAFTAAGISPGQPPSHGAQAPSVIGAARRRLDVARNTRALPCMG